MTAKERIVRFLEKTVPKKYWPKPILEEYVTKKYFQKMGKSLDLKAPKTFNEKIQWYKINYRNPEMTEIVDKISFKGYIEKSSEKAIRQSFMPRGTRNRILISAD